MKENIKLKDEFYKMQSVHLQDKEKIKHLISRISSVKNDLKIRPESKENICDDD